MELKEVQEYFKNAKKVRCLYDGLVYDLTKIKITRNIHKLGSNFWIDYEFGTIKLTSGNKFAEIMSYKNIYEITKEQLRSLTDPKVKEMFPDAFAEETFEYLEEVEASDYKDFSSSDIVRYVCKHVTGHYICFTKNENAISIKYIKKIK
jgi:hypothetical protein